jgi:hypothetical protein
MFLPLVAACTSGGTEPAPPEKIIVTPEPCTEVGPSVPFYERHPDKELYTWGYLSDEVLAPAACVHQAEAVNLFAVRVSDEMSNERVRFAVDFDNGYLYNSIGVIAFAPSDFNKPDVVLSAEALAELREAIDRYRVLEWPFRDPGEPVIDGEYTVRDGFELAVVFYDDTGSYADRPEKSDADMIGFLHFAQTFLAEQLK